MSYYGSQSVRGCSAGLQLRYGQGADLHVARQIKWARERGKDDKNRLLRSGARKPRETIVEMMRRPAKDADATAAILPPSGGTQRDSMRYYNAPPLLAAGPLEPSNCPAPAGRFCGDA